MEYLTEEQKKRLEELRARLKEISEITKPALTLETLRKKDPKDEPFLEKQIELMKQYHNESVDICTEIAKMTGEKNLTEGQYI